MADIDKFATLLLEESKRFLEKHRSTEDEEAKTAFLHSSLLLAFCGFEAHVNSVAAEFEPQSDLYIYERSILCEKEIRIEFGEPKLGGLKMYPITERFLFMYQRFSGFKCDRNLPWWADLSDSILLRNKLTHPKDPPNLTYDNVKRAVQSIISAVNALFLAIYKRPLPSANLDLQSRLLF